MKLAALAAVVLAVSAATGPFDIDLLPTASAPGATGHARLVYADSPFGVAVTEDGRARYDIRVTISGLPDAGALGAYRGYMAWAATPDLSRWERLGQVANGDSEVGTVDFNKFILVITAEADSAPASRTGPVVLRGTSPSGWLQTFLTHPLFRGIPQ